MDQISANSQSIDGPIPNIFRGITPFEEIKEEDEDDTFKTHSINFRDSGVQSPKGEVFHNTFNSNEHKKSGFSNERKSVQDSDRKNGSVTKRLHSAKSVPLNSPKKQRKSGCIIDKLRTNKKKVSRLENRSLKKKNEHFDLVKRQKNKMEEGDLDSRNISNVCETRQHRLNASSNLERDAHKHTSPFNSFFPNLIFEKKEVSHKTINRELSTINSNEIKSSFYKNESNKIPIFKRNNKYKESFFARVLSPSSRAEKFFNTKKGTEKSLHEFSRNFGETEGECPLSVDEEKKITNLIFQKKTKKNLKQKTGLFAKSNYYIEVNCEDKCQSLRMSVKSPNNLKSLHKI